ncbi:MAG: hypothetical protein IPO15_16015 [Anaerolineae bacterium]|nr:hypothetical protein [Anaerolineae bacterium]
MVLGAQGAQELAIVILLVLLPLLAPAADIARALCQRQIRFGAIISGSNSICTPKPLQVWQAPCGELKEKVRGSISGRLMPQWTQAKCSE